MEAVQTKIVEPDTDLSEIFEELAQNEESVTDEPRLSDVITDDEAPMFCTWKIGQF
jgi:hypothetical protein